MFGDENKEIAPAVDWVRGRREGKQTVRESLPA